ncbi:murein L,D-transpeptidase [Christiangramia fulva]|uniref:Murein L,D-transpeptidase n=1 Tax=Christiangramia fulva TaxID=2126553 RepID=A0A2R3Z9P9_9FLAO|nr:L,D-transpeptidase family protein [Christiangramia fulva]AVR47023.1 murein L,D-transpeptidase [Christiangramia fulva]
MAMRIDKFLYFLMAGIGFLLAGCNPNPKITDSMVDSSARVRNPIIKTEAKLYRPEIKYHLDSLESAAAIDSLFSSYSQDELENILALNRIDKNRLRIGQKLIIPDCAASNFNSYSPFPQYLPEIACVPKSVLIAQRIQAFALYENGYLLRWGPVSTGKGSTQTPSGLNYGNYKAKRKISTIDPSWIMPYYFNFMNKEGIGTHEYSLPGYPASHGCVRMRQADAKFIYDWAEMWQLEEGRIQKNGTPFIVFGKYDFSADKPWYDLASDMKANDLNDTEIDSLREYLNSYQNDPRNFPNPEPGESLLASSANDTISVN